MDPCISPRATPREREAGATAKACSRSAAISHTRLARETSLLRRIGSSSTTTIGISAGRQGVPARSHQPRRHWRRHGDRPSGAADQSHTWAQAWIAASFRRAFSALGHCDARLGPKSVAPPSTTNTRLVMQRAWSDNRRRTASQISQPVPSRLSTEAWRRVSRACSVMPRA